MELGKCSFHQIHFDFASNGTPSMQAGIYGTPLQVHDAALNKTVTIPAKSVDTPHKTLGHQKAPSGKNYCCLYLQVVTLSDLCLADGVTMDPAMLLGHTGPQSSTSTWIYIHQARPDESS